MKNYIIILLCLSLLLCGCQVAGNNAGTEPAGAPTVAPTVAPTDEPTQEPTVAPTTAPTVEPTQTPTEPPLPAGPIDVKMELVGSLKPAYSYDEVHKNSPMVSQLLHSQNEIYAFLTKALGEGYVNREGIDYTAYDDSFFIRNSVVVVLIYQQGTAHTKLSTEGIIRDTDGSYQGIIGIDRVWGGDGEQWFDVGFITMKSVTDDAPVGIMLQAIDIEGSYPYN